jgi:hypothetical protein
VRSEACQNCGHFQADGAGICERKGVPISKISGCSLSLSGKQFFRPKSGKEGYRLNVLGKHKEEVR